VRTSKPILYALSDLHLQAPIEPFLFTTLKETIFVKVAAEALGQGATFLLAGDVFDLTGMTPPPHGLAEFFKTAGVAMATAPEPPDVRGQLAALQATFPAFFECLKPLAVQRRLRFIPGNHDWAIGSPVGAGALAAGLGIDSSDLFVSRTYQTGDMLFACHGNQYDASNWTDTGSWNRGAVITAALYHALIPALDGMGFRDLGDAVPAVRPEENVLDGLEEYLGKARARTLLLALVELLLRNGYFTGLDRATVWLVTHLLPFLVSPARARRALADDSGIKTLARAHAEAILSGAEATDPPGVRPQVVVMGHTHELDGTRDYVNLGTWLDHITGLGREDLGRVDRTLPVLVVAEDGGASLYDCRGLDGPISSAPILWTRGYNRS
jgi:UDP-2,3-diacylglucosamine pyrophosphatase LpxH